MLIKVFNEKDCELLVSKGCIVLGGFCAETSKLIDMYVPVEKVEEVLKLEVNFINSNKLTF